MSFDIFIFWLISAKIHLFNLDLTWNPHQGKNEAFSFFPNFHKKLVSETRSRLTKKDKYFSPFPSTLANINSFLPDISLALSKASAVELEQAWTRIQRPGPKCKTRPKSELD